MTTSVFQKATKKRSKARIAIDGPTGSGKTYTSLIAATVLADGGKIAVIDTEHGSASLYSDEFNFDVLELTDFNPKNYIDAIDTAGAEGYAVVVVDSLSHAWEGEGGALELVDEATKRSKSGNSYTAWRDVTPLQRRMIDSMLQSKCHVIATMRSQMEYVQEKDDRTGKTIIRKVGMAPVQRKGMEYEFAIVADMDTDHNLVVSKSRCRPLSDKVVNKPEAKFWKVFLDWLNSGADESPPSQSAPAVSTATSSQPKGESVQAISETSSGTKRFQFRFTFQGQTQVMEYTNPNEKIAEALGKEPLKSWFGGTIVKHFKAGEHYRNHLEAHFGLKSAASLDWKMLGALQDHVIAGVEYPDEYHPTPKKESKKPKFANPEMGILVDELCKKFGVTELPEQALSEVLDGVEKGILVLSNADDRSTIEMTIAEALHK